MSKQAVLFGEQDRSQKKRDGDTIGKKIYKK